MTVRPITYYISFSVPNEVLKELESLDFYQSLILSSDLLKIAAMKSTGNYGAVNYLYALVRLKETKYFCQTNHYIDISALGVAVSQVAIDKANVNLKTKQEFK
jgi:hypothetical protein